MVNVNTICELNYNNKSGSYDVRKKQKTSNTNLSRFIHSFEV